MFGIIDENKKFILLDIDHDKLRMTALILSDGEKPMFDENTVDEAIKEYTESDIEIAYTGDKYLKGYAPNPSDEYQSAQREKAYIVEIDPITAHINRLKDEEQTEEIVAKIEELKSERAEKVEDIKTRYPYYENEEQEPLTQE